MTKIFISHSKKDAQLVENIKQFLENVGHTPIIEEFIPQEKQRAIPYEEITDNVKKSEWVFLFLTDNIVETEYTRNWVSFEIGVASCVCNKVFVFERLGKPLSYPIPYVTDYVLFNPDKVNDILQIQKFAKNLGKNNSKSVLAGLGAGAVIGSVAGPIGIVIGSIFGLLSGHVLSSDSQEPYNITCIHCNTHFNYHSPGIKNFNCPCCRKPLCVE